MGQTFQKGRVRLRLNSPIALAAIGRSVTFASLLLLLPSTGLAQTSEQHLRDSLQQARDSAHQLEALALRCLDEDKGGDACSGFRKALDGALLLGYQESCAIAKAWREEFVSTQAQDSAITVDRSAVLLRYLVDIEFLCGENALARNAASVAPAYRLSHASAEDSHPATRSLQYQLDSARQNALIDRPRSSLSGSYSSQNERIRRETQQQFDRLELELIRQQNSQLQPR